MEVLESLRTDRHALARAPLPQLVPDHSRSGSEVNRFSTLLLTDIERIESWNGACQNRALVDPYHQAISNPTCGEDIVAGCITPNRRVIYEFAMKTL